MAEKGQQICDDINSCDINEDTELARDIKELYRFIISDASITQIDTDTLNRQLDNCYRDKRVKIKDEETDKKVVEKVKVTKKRIGVNSDIKNYEKQLAAIKDDATILENLARSIERCTLKQEQLYFCDKILKHNKFAKRVYVIAFIVFILLLIYSVVSMIT